MKKKWKRRIAYLYRAEWARQTAARALESPADRALRDTLTAALEHDRAGKTRTRR